MLGRTPPRSKHSRSRSVSEEAPLITGWVARESNVVDKLLNKRYAALYPTTFVTYRRESDENPSKTFPISHDTSVNEVQHAQYRLRHQHTSTLIAVARGKYTEVDMWGFTVVWQSYTPGGDTLKLAFDTREQAEEWRSAFLDAISRQAARRAMRTDSSISETSTTGSAQEAPSPQRIEARRVEAAAIVGGEPPPAPSTSSRSAFANGGPKTATNGSEARRSRAWASVLHVNGVAVYVEQLDEEGEGGAIMVSAVVRAPPSDVFSALVQQRKAEGLGVLIGARTVEKVDANTSVITQQWKPVGALGGLVAPREVVLLRTWRQDADDGTYIVLYQSVDHRAVPRPRGRGWYQPVRVEVQAAGFTVSPLMRKYVHAVGGEEESQESLVTLVLKSDMGGWLSEGSWAARVSGPLGFLAARSVLEPVVTSVVILRDKVEQDRFVVRPLSMTAGEEVEALEQPQQPQPAGAAAAQRRLQRTTTMLAYRKETLAVAQKQAAQAVAAAAAAPPAELKERLPSVTEERPPAAPPTAAEAVAEQAAADAWAVGGTCKQQYWSSPGDAGFKVRGPDYLTSKKKMHATAPMFELVAVDLISLEDHMFDIARYLPSVRHSPAPFLFCVQLMVPCVPPISLVASWASPVRIEGRAPDELIAEYEAKAGPAPDSVRAFFRALVDFLEADGREADAKRNKKFKLIPNIAKGSWIIRQSVGTTPVLLGQKLTTKYARGRNYFEVDVDISSSSVAASVTNLVAGATKSLTIDLGVLIEGQTPETLPEQLLGTMRLDQLDLKTAAYLDEGSGHVYKPGEM